MQKDEFILTAPDGKKIHAYLWIPVMEASGILHIVHGMAEHAARYNDFALFLNRHGIAVVAGDLRGHGKTADKAEELGFFAESKGWDHVVNDVHEITVHIKKKLPNIPVYLIGHSMGSFIARSYIAVHASEISGCILSGTASHPMPLLYAAGWIAQLQMLFAGKRHASKLLDKLSFGAYNQRIKPSRTRFDWLSRDTSVADRYVADPYCGFVCSSGFFNDLFTGLKYINKQANISRTPSDLPLLFIAGSEDPVGGYGKGMIEATDRYKKAGVRDMTIRIYEGGRHEMLNEINKDEVYMDILGWLLERIKAGRE